jgi:hypothetical protein
MDGITHIPDPISIGITVFTGDRGFSLAGNGDKLQGGDPQERGIEQQRDQYHAFHWKLLYVCSSIPDPHGRHVSWRTVFYFLNLNCTHEQGTPSHFFGAGSVEQRSGADAVIPQP